SVQGVLEAVVLKRCICPLAPEWTGTFHRIFPVVRSRLSTRRDWSESSPAVMKTRSRHTIGDERPVPGNDVFQTMFSLDDQCSGATFSLLMPSPRGPRQPGQSSAGQ